MREHLTRAPVFSGALALWLLSGCVGPGLEPPGDQDDGRSPPNTAGTAGTGSAGTSAGSGNPDNIAGGSGAVSAGTGGGNAGSSGTTGAAGTGAAGMATSGSGGTGGAAGVGTAGAGSDAGTGAEDSGMPDGAPLLECEEGREELELSTLEDGGPQQCMLTLSETAAGYAPTAIVLALTDDSGTTLPDLVADAAACEPDGTGFYFVAAGAAAIIAPPATPVIGLCAKTCEQAADDAILEVLYGCEPTTR